jgi:hypothetical protein
MSIYRGYEGARSEGIPNTHETPEWLTGDYAALKRAGDELAAAAMRVCHEYDGVHRLRLAVAEWARVTANEGGRGDT